MKMSERLQQWGGRAMPRFSFRNATIIVCFLNLITALFLIHGFLSPSTSNRSDSGHALTINDCSAIHAHVLQANQQGYPSMWFNVDAGCGDFSFAATENQGNFPDGYAISSLWSKDLKDQIVLNGVIALLISEGFHSGKVVYRSFKPLRCL
ncbi:hypothetical protein Ccrd_021365 [Cynara cardunculus var. scolymus]|uniref:Uncharacterized protein n=1 Tax=Cynara cardunculus var. scolymus TaxID=59895 RepID=A0A103Y0N8_CYNCS|nr:hypothetical protein Ccrd_021365 [Cynara cardunculus var. scolymus]